MTQADTSKSENPPLSEQKSPVIFEEPKLTGNKWTDFQLAVRQISIWKDLQNLGQIPCARNSLLAGIASGVGVGVIRGLNVGPFVASNWAMGTFVFVTLGTWNVCWAAIRREREQVRVVVDKMAQRRVKKLDESPKQTQSEENRQST